jgi:hypothetical protein
LALEVLAEYPAKEVEADLIQSFLQLQQLAVVVVVPLVVELEAVLVVVPVAVVLA